MNAYVKRGILAACACLATGLAGCQSAPVQAPGSSTAVPGPSALPTAEQDTCQAASHASLLGLDYKRAPPAAAGKVIRVLCTTCPMTMDFNAERLNIFYDQSSGVISRLSCG